ncbi:hypothetical protein [Paenibacillus sp. V4I3]|uniref:hypothetical protein n=1 Tax=Paenibacillus sp. V4I3 TaxID=3042305 RepID=UPI0027D789BC|nr:hypothetical protein [Paenibacillus sp. V4I3]
MQKRLWTMRSIGTVIQWNPNVIKLVPLLEDDGDWPDKQFFDDMSAEYLKPFAAVISQLLEIAYAEAKG